MKKQYRVNIGFDYNGRAKSKCFHTLDEAVSFCNAQKTILTIEKI